MWSPDPSIIITAEDKAAAAMVDAWAVLRAERDRRLAETDWRITRHYEESLANGITPTLTPELFDLVFIYRQQLRDLPENTVDPANPDWPDAPAGF